MDGCDVRWTPGYEHMARPREGRKDPRGVRDLPRKLIMLGLVVGWLFLSALAGPPVRAAGPVAFGIVVLVAFTGL
jgi:hypothetical protein